MEIRKLKAGEQPPLELLLLADPSESLVNGYLRRGLCCVAEVDNSIIGVYVVLQTRPETVEIVNIAVDENKHGQGIGKQLLNHAIQNAKLLGAKPLKLAQEIRALDNWHFIRNADSESPELIETFLLGITAKRSLKMGFKS